MIHALINNDQVCTGYAELTKYESNPSLVYLPEGWNEDFLWRKWDNGWSSDKFEPPAPPQTPSVTDEIAALKEQNAEIIFALVMNDLI